MASGRVEEAYGAYHAALEVRLRCAEQRLLLGVPVWP